MAEILLQLNVHLFEAIGSITKVVEDEDFYDRWEVKEKDRPLTMNMNELVQVGGVSPSALPTTVFKTSTSF